MRGTQQLQVEFQLEGWWIITSVKVWGDLQFIGNLHQLFHRLEMRRHAGAVYNLIHSLQQLPQPRCGSYIPKESSRSLPVYS